MKSFLTIALIILALCIQAQTVSRLELVKGNEKNYPRTNIEIFISMDLEGLNLNDPVDNDGSEITLLQDDTGKDLLKDHREAMKEFIEQGRASAQVLRFYGIADYAANKDVILMANLITLPGSAARTIQLQGEVVFNFIDEANELTETFKIIKADKPDPKGVKTSIGAINIESVGELEISGMTYYKFRVVGLETPVINAELIGSDEKITLKLQNSGLHDGEFAIKEVSDNMEVKITYAATRKVKVPIDLNFSIGL